MNPSEALSIRIHIMMRDLSLTARIPVHGANRSLTLVFASLLYVTGSFLYAVYICRLIFVSLFCLVFLGFLFSSKTQGKLKVYIEWPLKEAFRFKTQSMLKLVLDFPIPKLREDHIIAKFAAAILNPTD